MAFRFIMLSFEGGHSLTFGLLLPRCGGDSQGRRHNCINVNPEPARGQGSMVIIAVMFCLMNK